MQGRWIKERLEQIPAGIVDIGIAAAVATTIAVAVAGRLEPEAQRPDALAYALSLAIAAPLLFRRRWPLGVFLLSVLLLVAYHALDYPAIGLAAPLAVALFTAARAGHLRTVIVVMAPLELWTLGWRALGEGVSPVSALGSQILVEFLLVASLVLLAEAMRSREAWTAEVAERLRRAEADREREAERRLAHERLRIARDLHDVLAHTVAVIGVQAGVADEALADAPEQARNALHAIRQSSREAMAEIRAAVGVLREPHGDAPRTPAPGLAQLDALVEVAADAALRVDVSVTGTPHSRSTAADLTAYRIVQESLTNVLRHSGASAAMVSIEYEPNAVVVEVADDGRGPTNGAVDAEGHGLAGMRERAAALGGRLEAGPADDGGTGYRVRAWLPTGARHR